MTPSPYPARNPFPHQGTLRLAGQRLDGKLPSLAGTFRTVARTPVRRLKGFLRDFQTRFQPGWTGDGGAAFVRGAHGSGKTHTIFAAWKNFGRDDRVFPAYVMLQDNNWLSIYEQFCGRLDLTLMVELSRGLLADMAVEELSATTVKAKSSTAEKTASEEKTLREDLKADPLLVKNLFSSYAVEEGATKARQRVTLAELTQGNSDLNRAVHCLQGDQFAEDAAKWFRMEPVAAEKLQLMGIEAPIRTPQQGAAALELLAALFSVANRPLVLFIDQCEKLTQGDAATALTNTGLLRSLAESFEPRNAALVLSGTPECWEGLPDDARQRIGLNVIDCEFLSLDEALDLVRLSIIPVEEEFHPGSGSLYPFTEEAIREIMRLSAGNPRKFLQYCHIIFRHAEASRSVIDTALVSSTAKSELSKQFFNKNDVVLETRRILTKQPYRLAEGYAVNQLEFDFALLDGQRAAVLVNVTDAIYADDEAANALLTADTIGKLRGMGEFAVFVLVATGYVSPEITERLRRAVSELIVFAPETFEKQLVGVLEWAREHPPSTAAREELTDAERTALRDNLKQIGTQRVAETVVVQRREDEVAETHSQRRYAERREQARKDWGERRRQIEHDIEVVRKERAAAETVRFENERRSANIRRWILDALLAICGGVTVYLGELMRESELGRALRAGQAPNQSLSVMLMVAGVVSFAIVVWDLVLIFIRGHLVLKTLSATELEELARRGDALVAVTWLRTPAMRFLVTAQRLMNSRERRDEEPSNLLKAEPLATLRLAYARLLGDRPLPPEAKAIVAQSAPEGAVLAEDAKVAAELSDARQPYDLLSVLYAPAQKSESRLACELCSVIAQGTTTASSPAAVAFERGLERADLSLLSFLSERQIRAALRELSPLEKSGLGAFDFLSKIAEIDQAYLFCSQLLLYFERDLLIPTE